MIQLGILVFGLLLSAAAGAVVGGFAHEHTESFWLGLACFAMTVLLGTVATVAVAVIAA